jgi:hypothetical protein
VSMLLCFRIQRRPSKKNYEGRWYRVSWFFMTMLL